MSHGRAADPVDLDVTRRSYGVAAVRTPPGEHLPAPVLQPLGYDPYLLLLGRGNGRSRLGRLGVKEGQGGQQHREASFRSIPM
jgi:hypothetical protein